jgi:hypothetical protein
MKRFIVLLAIVALSQSIPVVAAERGGGGGERASAPVRSSAPARQPVVINMSHSSSRGNNTHFQPVQHMNPQPSSYGRVQWPSAQPSRPAATVPQPRTHYVPNTHTFTQRPNAANFRKPGVNAANVVHHHPYTAGYVRKKLQKIGVTREPSYITDRSEIINTDRLHSTIRFPQTGPDHQPLSARLVSPRHFNDPIVRNQMAKINDPVVMARIDRFNAAETRSNYYYWHNEDGFNYCHYLDPFGYHWYGWYLGGQCFWTRYYGNRFWWYDSDFDRWCFWNEGYWWWQDPYHIGDLYCYTNDAYIPTNSAQDQIVVTSPDLPNAKQYPSPDGTRLVKVVGDTQDAFLYDTANPPSFNPVYLASGVVDVQYSNASNGRPLEVVLKLNDGSFDMFDGEGNAYNPGNFDADQAAQAASPADGSQPPDNAPAPADTANADQAPPADSSSAPGNNTSN